MTGADELIDELRRASPVAADLALRACLPVRVTPAFVRLARLRLLPQAGTGDEADLWLSALVESRSGSGFSLRREVRQHLRSRLADDPALLDQVWSQVHAAHAAWLAPRARLEEELTWRLLRDPADAAIDALWAGVVTELDQSANAEGIARWVTRALPDLPDGSLLHAHGRLAFHGAHLLLGDASVFGDQPQSFMDSAAFAFATRRLPRQAVTVGAIGQRVLASATDAFANGHTLQIPATRPLWLQVEPAQATRSAASPRVLLLDPAAPLAELALDSPFAPGQGGLRLRALDGAAWDLLPARQPAPPPAAARRPRVELSYEAEIYGAAQRVQLPFVVGVLADLGSGSQVGAVGIEDRKFLIFDADNLDERMKALRPKIRLSVPDPFDAKLMLDIHLDFQGLGDWDPSLVAAQIARHGHLQAIAAALQSLATRLEAGSIRAEPLLKLLADEAELARLRLGPDSRDPDLRALALAAEDFGTQALAFPDLLRGIENVCEKIRQGLNDLLDAVYHAPDFQHLEATWRGLHQLVQRASTDEMTKIRVMHVTKKELVKSLARSRGLEWDQNPLFKKVYEEEFGQFGGEPYGVLLVAHEFDQQPSDMSALGSLARIGAVAHAPVLTAASPALFQLESWRELAALRDLSRLFVTPEYAPWRSLRESDDARYLCLTLPRVLAREPWTAASSGAVPFDETTEGDYDDRFTWMSSAWLMAANIAQAFDRDRWFARITGAESGGLVNRLPTHGFRNGSAPEISPTGVAITDRMEAALSQLGLAALVPRRHSDSACFYSAPTLHQPPEYEDRDAAQLAQASARLAPVLACSRLMLTLACMLRDKPTPRAPDEIARELSAWASQYTGHEPGADEDGDTPSRPFESVQISIERLDDAPDQARLVVVAVPRYQFRGLRVPLRLVHRLPVSLPA